MDSLYASDGKLLQEKYESMNLCVMGAGAVGKSALTLRFIQGKFVQNYDPTIEDAYRKQIDLDGNYGIILDILDTAGQEDFECLRTQWMKNKDGFILVFSITQKTSFNQLKEFYDGICEVYDDNNVPPIILAGNKVDLDPNHPAFIDPEREAELEAQQQDNEDDDEPKKNGRRNKRVKDYSDSDDEVEEEKRERQVSYDEAMAFARKIGAAHYVETSAKSGYNVEHMVGKMVRHLINIKFKDENKSRKQSTSTSDKKWWSKCTIL
eukprot:CAMPEP_0201596132 /NCGR_PEP_ID=MMETSP0190_2-20130828/192905_1 /ASSEMBLY_ACC=CAM_ASM_000263 /TAXON_ID=37353 /ORGANISM="Rosalina sp." /LENGTH=264 /DNA_ID=CAMNT_0048056357 /DNA_START=455 /DNA_END=1249 /DNA_ORIENTATION=-